MAPTPAAHGASPGAAHAGPGAGDAGAAAAVKTARSFYGALASRDVAVMASCYDKNVRFYDPLFRNLNGAGEVMEMWKTITPAANPATFKVDPHVLGVTAHGNDGSFTVKVHWDAHYDLGSRHIDNHADSTLVIKDGKIVEQRDDWDLGAWMKQALPIGGGSALVAEGASLAAHSFIEIKAFFDKHH